ncbi:MAG: DEAD/DEAH box helicase [Verrucomicrobiales bacterium]|nr:DEAD/DEAH box helicase [Verrucomicrobiales bacterium]
MEFDRAVQHFLARFPDTIHKEAERLRQQGAIKQIFGGPQFVQARIEDGADVYRVTFRKEKHGWEYTLRGPEPEHPAVVCAAMLERVDRGEALPDSPNEVDNLSLTAMLEEKLGRGLNPDEDRYVEKLERRYKKYTLEDAIHDTDLVRLNSKWPVEGFEPITLWPEPPANIIEFWNYIASAFEKKKLAFPAFMAVITDKEATKEKLSTWEQEREAEFWMGRLEHLLTKPEVMPHPAQLRLRVTTREARLQFRNASGTFESIPNDVEALRLANLIASGEWRLDAVSHLLWTLWTDYGHEGEPPVASLRLDAPGAAALLGSIFRQQTLVPIVITLDEVPFHRAVDPLRWHCTASENGAAATGHYVLQLLMPDGEPVPYDLAVLPGAETLYLSDDAVFRGPPAWTDSVEVPPRVEVPSRILETEQGLQFLLRLGAEPPEALRLMATEVCLLPHFSFRLAKRGSADNEVVLAEISARDHAGTRVELLEKDAWRIVENQPLPPGKLAVVDRSKLRTLPKLLEEMAFCWDGPQKCFRTRVVRTFPEKFTAWLAALPADAIVTLDQDLTSLRSDPVQATVRFELAESEEIDWFDLKILVDVRGLDLSRTQIRELVSARGGYVRMPDGKWMRLSLTLTEEQQASIARLGLDVYDLSGESHRVHTLQLADPGAKEIFDERAWERICSRANSLKLQVRPAVPPELKLALRPYQIEGFHFLAYLTSNRFGGLLADDMGLGKTAQSLTWLLWLRSRWKELNADKVELVSVPPALVVAPKSVLDVWANECRKWAPHLRVQVIRNKEDLDIAVLGRDVDVLVMNYSQLRVNVEKLKEVQWLNAILDEGQQIKNPDSMAARAARELKAEHRLVLSGTPIENRLLDVWSLMAFAMPGVLGNRKSFRDRFDRRKDPQAQIRLSARLRPFILRRTKGQVALDLPPRTEEDVISKMEDAQEEMYQAELGRMQRLLLGFESDAALRKNSFVVLQGLMRLRQICCHPALLDPTKDDSTSAKMTALFYLLDQLRDEGHKCLVFSQFVSMLEIIQKRLVEEDRPHCILTGQSKDRGAIVEGFQTTKDPTVFLLSLKAGGSGLNLTAASYVILYDPWWNPAVENQAIDRTHRIGQTNPVIAYRLLIRNSVEEKIRRLQQQKQMLFTGVLGEESFSSNLQLSDLQFLFNQEE